MPNTVIQLKKSSTPSSTPSDLANGELAINFADGKLFYKDNVGVIKSFVSAAPAIADSFGIVNAAGTLIIADTSGDVLNLVAGDNITIIGNSLTDTITISATGNVTTADVSAAFNKANSANYYAYLVDANATAAFAKANNALANTTGTFEGTLTVKNDLIVFGNTNIDAGALYVDATNSRVGIGTTTPQANLSVIGNIRFATDNVGANYLEFIRTGGNAWRWATSGVGDVLTINGNSITIPQNVLIQRQGLTVTPTTSTASSVQVNHTYNDANARYFSLNVATTDGGSTSNTLMISASVNNNVRFSVTKSTSGWANFNGQTLTLGQGETSGFQSKISHSGNESLYFTPYNQLVLALSAVDFTPSVQITSGKSFGWSSTTSQSNSPDLVFWRDAANTFGQRNGTAGQAYRLYGTYTDVSNYERLSISANSTAHYIIGEEGGTGSARPLHLGSNNVINMTIDTAGRVGIGTTSPAAAFHVGTSLANSYTSQIARITSNNNNRIATVTGDGRVYIGSDNGYNVVFSVDNKGEKRDSSYTMLIRDTNNMLMSSTGFVTDAANFSFGANNFGGTIEFIGPAGNGMLRNNKANTTIGQGSQAGSPDKTLRVWTTVTDNPTSLRVRESDWQGVNESFGVYANNDTTPRLVVASGNVGIGTSSPGYKLEVNGSFAATTKSFVIKHPTKKGMKLRYGSLEGPENGVYVRGRITDGKTIELPDYWHKLVDKDSITVSLTPIGKTQMPSVNKVTAKKITLIGENIDCFYHVFAERKDVDKLIVEIDE